MIQIVLIQKLFLRVGKNYHQKKRKYFLISNFNLLKDQFKKLKYKIVPVIVKNIFKTEKTDNMKIINIDINYNPLMFRKKAASKFIIKSLNLAHRLALNKNIAGIINCPINKNLLNKKILV